MVYETLRLGSSAEDAELDKEITLSIGVGAKKSIGKCLYRYDNNVGSATYSVALQTEIRTAIHSRRHQSRPPRGPAYRALAAQVLTVLGTRASS